MAMPLGHGSEQQRLRPLQRREKLLARGVGGVTAIALAVVLILSLTHGDRRSGHGCIAVSLAYSMGGTQTYACGARARTMCAGSAVRASAAPPVGTSRAPAAGPACRSADRGHAGAPSSCIRWAP